MNISKAMVEKILKTLPIGYYIKRDVKTFLTDENGSYYDMMKDEIYISYPMIEKVCKSLPSDQTIENDVRCLLYHEVSHAFITPKDLKITNYMNIFEDERIETLLRKFYLGVNFRDFVKRVNNYRGEQPSTGDELFYQIVRYRVGPKKFVEKVSELIKTYSSFDSWYDNYRYEGAIRSFYQEVLDYFKDAQQLSNKSSQSTKNDSNEFQNGSNEISNENESQCESQDENQTSNSSQSIVDMSDDDSDSLDKTEAEKLVSKSISEYDSSDVKEEIEKILQSVKNQSKQNGSAINAYSGVFNPRSVVRDDYKYFVQQNRSGHVKAYSKIHLNLFIDCSGSFYRNDVIVNQFLKALYKFEKENTDFSYTLISCGIGQTIRDKNDRVQHSSGGTLITPDIIEQYKRVQLPNAQNINICLYDGDACEHVNAKERTMYGKSFKAFDSKNCVVIVDPENERYMRHCKSAKVILTRSYTSELKAAIVSALQSLCR